MDEKNLAKADGYQGVALLGCCGLCCARMNHRKPAWRSLCRSPLQRLTFEAYAKAERAQRRWQAARRASDERSAVQARRLMLRHRAIAYCLDPNREVTDEPA